MKTIPSIDMHIDGLRITSVVRLGDDFIVSGNGGAGGWYDQTGDLESIAEMKDFEATFGIYNDPGWADRAEAVLHRWQDENTPLTATTLPTANVLTDGVEHIVFPRTNR